MSERKSSAEEDNNTDQSGNEIYSIDEEAKEKNNPSHQVTTSYYSWVLVMSALMAAVTPMGLLSAWGVLLEYYQREIFNGSKETTTQLAAVADARRLVMLIFMIPLGYVYSRVGPKPLLYISVIVSPAAILLLGIATSTITRVLPQWFDNKTRSTAFGLGGLVVPLITTVIEKNLGGPCLLADRIGNINTGILFTFTATLATASIWTQAYSIQTLQAYAVIYGFSNSVMSTLLFTAGLIVQVIVGVGVLGVFMNVLVFQVAVVGYEQVGRLFCL
ncbi:hypothetical protein BJV82DRAFT_575590 [Fennellomyces sp. T-0311]|nr:hypothetical protein BJV82DRAFT_575590 [Fennellomyces sp. T-0311]